MDDYQWLKSKNSFNHEENLPKSISYCMINLSKNLMINVGERDATKLFFIIARTLSLINAYKSWEKFIKELSYENEKLREENFHMNMRNWGEEIGNCIFFLTVDI